MIFTTLLNNEGSDWVKCHLCSEICSRKSKVSMCDTCFYRNNRCGGTDFKIIYFRAQSFPESVLTQSARISFFLRLLSFLVGNMPLNFLTFLKLSLWSSKKNPEGSIFRGGPTKFKNTFFTFEIFDDIWKNSRIFKKLKVEESKS